MPKDARPYITFTVEFPYHPKIAILSDKAFRCLHEAISHSRQLQTDGLLHRRFAIERWGSDVLQELCTNDDENPSLVECEKGWMIHDYDEHQVTSTQTEDLSEKRKRAGQKGGIASGQARGKQERSKTEAKLKQNEANGQQNEAEIELELDNYVGGKVGDQRSLVNARAPDDGRFKDRMGRPAMNLTVLSGGNDAPKPPPPPDRRVRPEAKEIIRESLPPDLSHRIKWGVEMEITKLFNSVDGITKEEIAAVVKKWFADDDECKPGNIQFVHGQMVQKRFQSKNGGQHKQLATSDKIVLRGEELKQRFRNRAAPNGMKEIDGGR